MRKFKVGDRVAVHGTVGSSGHPDRNAYYLRGDKGVVTVVNEPTRPELPQELVVDLEKNRLGIGPIDVASLQCRKLVKGSRRRVWVTFMTASNQVSYTYGEGEPRPPHAIEFIEVRRKK